MVRFQAPSKQCAHNDKILRRRYLKHLQRKNESQLVAVDFLGSKTVVGRG
jgi:hypothetical protein